MKLSTLSLVAFIGGASAADKKAFRGNGQSNGSRHLMPSDFDIASRIASPQHRRAAVTGTCQLEYDGVWLDPDVSETSDIAAASCEIDLKETNKMVQICPKKTPLVYEDACKNAGGMIVYHDISFKCSVPGLGNSLEVIMFNLPDCIPTACEDEDIASLKADLETFSMDFLETTEGFSCYDTPDPDPSEDPTNNGNGPSVANEEPTTCDVENVKVASASSSSFDIASECRTTVVESTKTVKFVCPDPIQSVKHDCDAAGGKYINHDIFFTCSGRGQTAYAEILNMPDCIGMSCTVEDIIERKNEISETALWGIESAVGSGLSCKDSNSSAAVVLFPATIFTILSLAAGVLSLL